MNLEASVRSGLEEGEGQIKEGTTMSVVLANQKLLSINAVHLCEELFKSDNIVCSICFNCTNEPKCQNITLIYNSSWLII